MRAILAAPGPGRDLEPLPFRDGQRGGTARARGGTPSGRHRALPDRAGTDRHRVRPGRGTVRVRVRRRPSRLPRGWAAVRPCLMAGLARRRPGKARRAARLAGRRPPVDVEHNNFWERAWPERPDRMADALEFARQELARVPKMVPVYGHRYLPGGRGTSG